MNRMERLRDSSHARAMPLAEIEQLFRDGGLAIRRRAFYRLPVELEAVLERSFPAPGDADRVRATFAASLADDALGLGARRHGEREIRFEYPVVIVVGECPPQR